MPAPPGAIPVAICPPHGIQSRIHKASQKALEQPPRPHYSSTAPAEFEVIN